MDYLVKISNVVAMLEELATKAKELWDEYDDAQAFGVMSAYAAAANQVKSIPPAQRWIPCSERLPEPRKAVLGYTPTYQNTYAVYYDDIRGWIIWDPLMRSDCFPSTQGKIVAWMPMPEPYEEKNKNEN